MAEAITAPVIQKAVDFVFDHTYRELQYIWKFHINIQSLSNAHDKLLLKRDDIRNLVDDAKRNAEVIKSEVKDWLEDVEAMTKDVVIIVQGEGQAQMGCFFNCKCPNIKLRYSLSKNAAAKTTQIAELNGRGEQLQSRPVGDPVSIVEMPLTSHLDVVVFESRQLVEEQVMNALLDDNIPVIAVCGMGGVGKTTLVKKIADDVKRKNYFDEVALAVVSRKHEIIEVQQQLAERLGLKIQETTVAARADRLRTRLMGEGKKILVIIDDLWEELKYGDIGIPNRKGLKVIITSRLRDKCRKMGIEKIIEVGELREEEAWGLFKRHANISDDDFNVLKYYPKMVADKCNRLPLAIEVIGKALKDIKELPEWRDALQQLNNAQDSDSDILEKIGWSVDYLGSQARSLLLLCSLFPEDYEIEIEHLVRYAKGLQFLEGIEKMTETRDRVGTIIRVLTDRYLLIACDNYRVKLHDVVRDTCLRIASKGDNVFMVSHSILKEWPDMETHESYTAISLDFDSNLIELPSGLNCSSLQLLRLSNNRGRNNILNNLTSFLEATEKLRVLNINLLAVELPQSLQTSMNLRTLNLHNCLLNGDLSALLERLVKVEVLSFFESTYEGKWPKEIGKLSNLKSLDMRFENGPKESLPTGILNHLKKLEELYLNLKVQMCLPESHEVIKEIGSMSNLNTIWISRFNSPSLVALVENLNVERLSRFYFNLSVVGWVQYQFSRTMIVNEANMGMLLEPKMKALLNKVDEYLELDGVTGFNNDFDGGSVFSRSRILKLRNCEMKYICNTTNSAQGVFVHLETLYIEGAEHLEGLCHGNIPPGSFVRLEEVTLINVPLLSCLWGPIEPPSLGNLASLTIHDSKLITSLVLRSSVKCFAQLRVLEIKSCPKLETIVSCNGKIEKDTVEDMSFKKLEELYLDDLDSFKTLCSEQEAPNTVLTCRANSNISLFPKLRKLWISGFHLHVCNYIKNGQNLSSLRMANCDSVEVCFDFEGWSKEITGGERVAFHKLNWLILDELPNLRHLLKNLPEGTVAFQNLRKLYISNCGSLNHLLTPSTASTLASLKELRIWSCQKLESIVDSKEFSAANSRDVQEGTKLDVIVRLDEKSPSRMIFNQLEHLSLQDLPRFISFRRMVPEGTVGFQKLLTLTIHRCDGLRYLLTPPMVKMFGSLKELEIEYCEQMETIIGSEEEDDEVATIEEQIDFPELCKLKLRNLPKLRMICSEPIVLSLPYWKKFELDDCPMINRFCAGNMIGPELKQVTFLKSHRRDDTDFVLDLENTRKWFKDCELGNRCIQCARYAKGETCDHLREGSSTNKNNEDDTNINEDKAVGEGRSNGAMAAWALKAMFKMGP